MVVRNENSRGYLAGIVIVGLALLGMLVYAILNPPYSLIELSKDILIGDVFLLLWVFLVIQFFRWRPINRRRQEAAKGNYFLVPLATIQPAPIVQKFDLWLPLRLKPNLLTRLALYCVGAPLYAATMFLLNWKPSGIGDLWLYLLIWLVFYPLSILRTWLLGREKIDVTNRGFSVNSNVIFWSEVRLFAIRGAGQPGSPAQQYELAGETRVITWHHLRHSRRWRSFYKPPASYEAYEEQMAHLLEFIAAKTNLPLYDVR